MQSQSPRKDYSNLLKLQVQELLSHAQNSIENKDLEALQHIDLLVKRYFCKSIVRNEFEKLETFSKHMVKLFSWFNRGSKAKWEEGVPIIRKWDTIFELNELILGSKSPQQAYKEMQKSYYGEKLIKLLIEHKMLKPSEIAEKLGIKKQQVSALLGRFEKVGLIIREVHGKNVWVSLGSEGIRVYKKFIEPKYTQKIEQEAYAKLFPQDSLVTLELVRLHPKGPVFASTR